MAINKKTPSTYYEKHSKLLAKVVKTYKESSASNNLFATSDFAVFNSIETGITKHPLRYYQMEALYMLDYLLKCNDDKIEKSELMEIVDEEKKTKAPFLSYEMATGSGKTMLMGASIYFLNQKYDIDNFLIITPASTDIYQKTIRNFQVGNYDSVWADDTPFTFNLITGDNYSQNLFFDKKKDANIFIFNISKFGSNATNTELTWESAVWQDEKGNNISIKQFLKDKKLIIITDEAHHAQTKVASKIIRNFHPSAVLEFTATAIEKERGLDKKNQTIIYKYDIRKFLEDGHGKLVRAVALSTGSKAKQKEVNDNEKLKLVTLFLIHLLKKEAVLLDPKSRSLKPVSFVKVKQDTIYTQKVFNYIKDDLANDVGNIEIIIDKIKAQDLEITSLLTDQYKKKYLGKLKLLREDIQKVANSAIFYYGQSDKETEKKFLNIRKNEVEVVVYMQRLDEGIDLPNIFSMAVINDTDTDFKTSVKQIIGRGVRLNKDKREFDDEENLLKANSEMLHIVCDQGKNFEEVIEAIQKEFGLNNKYLSFDKVRKPIINKAKSELLNGKYIPHIKADLKAKPDVSLMSLITNVEGITSKFMEENCFEGESDETKRFLKYRPDQFFIEVDIFSDKSTYHKQIKEKGGKPTTLHLTEKEFKKVYGMVQKNLPVLPDTETSKQAFREYFDKFNQIGLQYYKLDESDDNLALKLFTDAFSFYYRNKIEKDYFTLDFRQINTEESWNLKKEFKNIDLRIPDDQVTKNLRLKVNDKAKLIELIESQYYFKGFEKSIYDYDRFDSYPEKQLADYADDVLKGVAKEKKPFWIRNQRNIYFTNGTKRYYPDFILFKDDWIYVIETKGEKFSDTKKNALLKKLDEVPGDGVIKGYKGLLVFSSQMEKMGTDYAAWDIFINEAEETLIRQQTREQLISDPKVEDKFIKYIPAYSPDKAFRKFIKNQKTPKPDGWLFIEGNTNKLPETVFATQAKGQALYPRYDHNSWVILNHVKDFESANGKLALVNYKEIDDDYEGNCTIRKIEVIEKKTKGKLFGEKALNLLPINSSYDPITIDDIETGGEVEIVGLEYPLMLSNYSRDEQLSIAAEPATVYKKQEPKK
jgi:superfamily II DNA or RNA helicase